MKSYDLVVIGSGSASTSAAYKCLEKGWKIAIIDHKPIGGTCALRGCDPKKVLVGVTDSVEAVKRLQGSGTTANAVGVDWRELMSFKRTFTESMSSAIEEGLKRGGVDLFHGHARFEGPDRISVGDEIISGKKILIASGAKAANPNFPGSEHLIDNEGFLNLDRLPKSIVFVGGGYISVEFASIARKAGSDATIVQKAARVLVNFDEDVVAELTKALTSSGVKILTRRSVNGVEKKDGGYSVHLTGPEGDETIRADLVVHGAGRDFDSDMEPSKGNIHWSNRGIKVNEYLQSVSNPIVYAAGDSADTKGYKLTPIAVLEGYVVAHNMLSGNHEIPDYEGTPTASFSTPPLAMVGLTEKQARDQGIKVKVNSGNQSLWYNSRRRGIKNAFYKVLIDEEKDQIVGAHILGENSEEVINVFALAIREKIGVKKLMATPFAYPSDTNDIKYMLA